MSLQKIPYTSQLFLPIRDFLADTYQTDPVHPNWQIDRWNFCRHVSQVIHETSASWPATVGVWVDDSGAIQALANSEGEDRGEVFIQLGLRTFSDAELEEFLTHAEAELTLPLENSRKRVDLHVGPRFRQLIKILEKRGYQMVGKEAAGIFEIREPLEVILPEGLRLVEGAGFSDQGRGLAHSLAFGYTREGVDVLEDYHIIEAFANMRRAPDYRGDLDLAILGPAGEVAGFANFWFDKQNRIGILEPLGTIPAFQKQGLASALLSEGINRLRKLGANRLYGGAGQPFYRSFGFTIVDYRQIWRREG